MADTLADVMGALKTRLATVTGIADAQAYPQDKPYTGVAIECRPQSGAEGSSLPGGITMLHTLTVDLYKPAGNLTDDMEVLVPLIEPVWKKIAGDVTFTGEAQTYGDTSYSYFYEDWAGVQVRGFRFTISGIKIQAATTA